MSQIHSRYTVRTFTVPFPVNNFDPIDHVRWTASFNIHYYYTLLLFNQSHFGSN